MDLFSWKQVEKFPPPFTSAYFKETCACLQCLCRCRWPCTHQKTAPQLPVGPERRRGCCEFICHMPREHWNRSTIIHSSGLQRNCLPFSLIHSPICTSDTPLLHLAFLVDIKPVTIINLDTPHRPGSGKRSFWFVERKLIAASSDADELQGRVENEVNQSACTWQVNSRPSRKDFISSGARSSHLRPSDTSH